MEVYGCPKAPVDLTLGEKPPEPIGDWVGPGTCLGASKKTKTCCRVGVSPQGYLVVSS